VILRHLSIYIPLTLRRKWKWWKWNDIYF